MEEKYILEEIADSLKDPESLFWVIEPEFIKMKRRSD
jgi:hypothetical protein